MQKRSASRVWETLDADDHGSVYWLDRETTTGREGKKWALARKLCGWSYKPRAGVKANVLSQDAAQFSFPPGNAVVYLYNPFGPSVLDPVLDRLLASTDAKCYIVYVNPVRRRQCFELWR